LRVLFLIISFICGFLTGAQFPLANKIHLKDDASLSKTAGILYSSDLLGGWLGGIVGGVVLLPVLGLLGSCVVVFLLKLCSFIVITAHARATV
jgi:spermidine synthase